MTNVPKHPPSTLSRYRPSDNNRPLTSKTSLPSTVSHKDLSSVAGLHPDNAPKIFSYKILADITKTWDIESESDDLLHPGFVDLHRIAPISPSGSNYSQPRTPEQERLGAHAAMRKSQPSNSNMFSRLFKRRSDVMPQSNASLGKLPGSDSQRHGAELRGPDAKTVTPVSLTTGERSVIVRCGKLKIRYPVTPHTTAMEVIQYASERFPELLNATSAVLLEHFTTVGVQRPLRHYESVLNVMNSWNDDRQNSLILLDPGTGSAEREVTMAGVPRHHPPENSWLLEYSQKVGKWEKRLITLHQNGQMTMQRPETKYKMATRICHLSDFDIYVPTKEKLREKVKSPKKFCFAIKSQQKTTVFESIFDFVHFFCTNDRHVADGFYSAVQSWRSWYLVHVLGGGRKEQSGIERNEMGSGLQGAKSVVAVHPPSKNKGQSLSSPSAATFTKSSNQFDTSIPLERRSGSVTHGRDSTNGTRTQSLLGDDEPLANLGRKLSSARPRDPRPSTDQGHSTGKALPIARSNSKPAVQRNTSTKTKGQPLIDLTDQYRDPGQHARKGRAFAAAAVGPGGLINNAMSHVGEPITHGLSRIGHAR